MTLVKERMPCCASLTAPTAARLFVQGNSTSLMAQLLALEIQELVFTEVEAVSLFTLTEEAIPWPPLEDTDVKYSMLME